MNLGIIKTSKDAISIISTNLDTVAVASTGLNQMVKGYFEEQEAVRIATKDSRLALAVALAKAELSLEEAENIKSIAAIKAKLKA